MLSIPGANPQGVSAPTKPSLRPPRFWVPCIFAIAAVVYLGFILSLGLHVNTENGARTYYCLYDDAMVSMRYARNLVDGYGLVWNPGGPAVEGYSNPLWVLWMAVVHLFRLDESKVCLPVMVSGIAILLANLLVVWRVARLLAPRAIFGSLLALMLVAFYYPLAYWTLMGMEVGLFALLTSAMVWIVLKIRTVPPSKQSARLVTALLIVVVAILLLRPDGLVPVVVVGFFLVHWSPRQTRWKRGILIVLATALPIAALTCFRAAYFHDLLPNTYYLKLAHIPLLTRLERGIYYLGRTLLQQLLWVAIPALYYVYRQWRSHRSMGDTSLLFFVVLSLCAYSVYVGGDSWENIGFPNRYLNAVIPLAFILAALGIDTALVRTLHSPDRIQRVLKLGVVVAGLLMLNRFFTMATTSGIKWTVAVSSYWALSVSVLLPVIAIFLVALAGPLSRRVPLAKIPFLAKAIPPYRGLVPVRPPHLLLGVFVLWWIPLNLSPVTDWIKDGAPDRKGEYDNIRLALLIRNTTRKDARIASGFAGALPYFAHRRAVDLQGKCDPVIAKGPPAANWFVPGHNKWNNQHSFGELRPDVSRSPTSPTPEVFSYLQSLGYVELPNGLLVLKNSPRILSSRIAEEYWRSDFSLKSVGAAHRSSSDVHWVDR